MIQISKIKCLKLLRTIKRDISVTVKGTVSGEQAFLDNYNELHLQTTQFQKTLLGLGSAVMSLANPWRGDMIAAMAETTGLNSVEHVREKMLSSEEGRRILDEKPRINSSTVNVAKLGSLNEGTVGKAYFNFLKKYNYTPDARLAVRFVDDVELAYVVQRYREVHDLIHTILNMPTNMLGEVTVKWVEGIQTKMPMCVGGAVFGAARLAPKYCRHYSTQPKTVVSLNSSVTSEPPRHHPGIRRVRRVNIPDHIKSVIITILKDRNVPDVYEEGKKFARYLQCRKPPISEDALRDMKRKLVEEVNVLFGEDTSASEEEREYRQKRVRGKVASLLHSRLYHWKPMVYSEASSQMYLASRAAPEYAAASRVFNEIYKRDPRFKPKNFFNYRSGVGSVTWAAHALWGTTLKEYFTVDPSVDMNELARLILQGNKPEAEPCTPGLFQRQFLPETPRQYDVVVSAYSLFEFESQRAMMDTITNLWSKTSKYLVIIEHGTNAGFKLVTEVRDIVLQISNQSAGECHVVAPCPHDFSCPRLTSEDKPTPCNFPVKYSSLENTEETHQELFSYVILKKGKRNEDGEEWPRIVREILSRHKHIICRLCTSSGQLDEVILTKKKHGEDLYKCAKYSSWGDLLPVSLSRETADASIKDADSEKTIT